MIVVLCIDDKNGMLFNHRRQSRDKAVIEDLVTISGEKKIYINGFSEELFLDNRDKTIVDDDFLDKAGTEDICFVENIDVTTYADKIDKIILYHWNRHYPSNLKFTMDLSAYTMTESVEFSGNSHEKITREEYSK